MCKAECLSISKLNNKITGTLKAVLTSVIQWLTLIIYALHLNILSTPILQFDDIFNCRVYLLLLHFTFCKELWREKVTHLPPTSEIGV